MFVFLLTVIVIAGKYGWTELILSYFDRSASVPVPVLLGFGFLAGSLSFFAPCAFVLFPGYVSYYLSQAQEEEGARRRLIPSIRAGSACGLGAASFFLLLGLGVSLVGTSLSQYLIDIKPWVAGFFVLLGVLLLANVTVNLSWIRHQVPVLFSASTGGGTARWPSFFLYGFGYALATTGCTFPLFASLIIVPIASGHFLTGVLTFFSFALAMGLLMIGATVLVGFSREALMRRLIGSAQWIKRITGMILILAGLYLGYFFIRAGM